MATAPKAPAADKNTTPAEDKQDNIPEHLDGGVHAGEGPYKVGSGNIHEDFGYKPVSNL